METRPAAKRNRVLWTDEEIHQIVDRFGELRAEDPIGPVLPQIKEAQRVLPADRRRDSPTLDAYGSAFKRIFSLKVAEMKAKLRKPLRPSDDDANNEPTILTIEVPKIVEVEKAVDPYSVLSTLSVGTVLGHGIDRLIDGIRASSTPGITSVPRPEKPAKDHIAKAEDTKQKKIRVLAVGVFPDSKRFIEEKIKGLTNIELSICDSNQTKIPSGTFDYVIMLRRIVSHSAAQQVRDLHGRERLVFVEGGQSELLKKLADINSQRDVSS